MLNNYLICLIIADILALVAPTLRSGEMLESVNIMPLFIDLGAFRGSYSPPRLTRRARRMI
ncbi:MAG: hypothetical protein COV46_03745 [Deltaproteobacteria bacterium CG11_big_fil_rev_8_21_14_0_20_49_13]|nr:MAG: hypothetical protein COV46_03745 [Deltaproteobacteria bacterium CG11_big_fil_rev_8_21_14_0_20_49_13]